MGERTSFGDPLVVWGYVQLAGIFIAQRDESTEHPTPTLNRGETSRVGVGASKRL